MKIIRRNQKKGDCAVVAGFNASSWCHSYKPYKVVEKIAKSCGYHPERGMYIFQFANLMKKLKIPAKRVKPKNMYAVESKLYLGSLLIFLYTHTGSYNGHVMTAFMDHKGRIRLINTNNEPITWDDFASDIQAREMSNFAVYEVPPRSMVKKNDV